MMNMQSVEEALRVAGQEYAHEPQPTQALFRKCIADPPIATWYLTALKASNDQLKSERSEYTSSCPDASMPHVGGTNQPVPGNDTGVARAIPRVRLSELSPLAFYKHFIRPGMPAVITGLFDENRSFWEPHTAELERMVVQQLPERDRVGNESKRCQGEADCMHRVHFAESDARAYAALQPANVPSMLHFPDPFPRDRVLGQLGSPHSGQVILTFNGGIFGGPLHYDMSCAGSISIQYKGVKRWSLWAPWDVMDGVPSHTRYEAVVSAGDFIWFPPAWYHGTQVLSERSLTVAHFVQDVPNFGDLRHLSLWRQPYGFERCAVGWRARAAAWDFLLAQRRRERRRERGGGAHARGADAEEQEEQVEDTDMPVRMVEQEGSALPAASGVRLNGGEPPHLEL